MEKRYFVLKKGYLNINEDFFYFSDHGNWDTCEILDETEVPRLTFFNVSNYIIQVIYSVLAIVFGVCLFTGKFEISLIPVVFTVIFYIVNLQYNIKYFKIPTHKVEYLSINGQKLTIRFANKKNKSVQHTVKLDDQKETKDFKIYLQKFFNHKLHVA